MKKLLLLFCALTLTVTSAQTKKKTKKVVLEGIFAEIYTNKGKISLQLEYPKKHQLLLLTSSL